MTASPALKYGSKGFDANDFEPSIEITDISGQPHGEEHGKEHAKWQNYSSALSVDPAETLKRELC